MDSEFLDGKVGDDDDFPTEDLDGLSLEDLLDEGDTEDASDVVLVYADEVDGDALAYGDCLVMAQDILSQYDLEEIISLNELSPEEVLAFLFEQGEIGLPSEIEDEEVSGLPPEEAEED